MVIYGADVGNAFAEAPPPKQGFYILPDRAFKEWWEAKGFKPLKEGQVIPVMRAMQGHPESSRLWEKHIDRIIRKHGFKPTIHEPCLYIGYVRGERCIFKRQVSIKLAGGVIAYKTRLQPTVANSSTEAEFMGAHDAGKMVLFIRSILFDLGIPQQAASVIYEDNDGATAMANAQKPTSRTRHMDTRYFALSEWVERDLMILERIHTSINEADHFTKVLDRTLFYRHIDHIMGHIPPPYSPCFDANAWTAGTVVKDEDFTRDSLAIRPEAARAAKCIVDRLDLWVDLLSHVCESNPIWNNSTLDCGGVLVRTLDTR
jgi:hypothetical protein